MSQTIDQRVVEMRFDNKQFESAIADTQKSVKNFNKNLNKEFSDSSKSLDKLEGTAEKVRLQFNLWDMLKFETLHRVLDGLIAKAASLVKSFTIEPVKAGWDKYASKVESVQQMMNAIDQDTESMAKSLGYLDENGAVTKLGKSLGITADNLDETAIKSDFVAAQLDKLNWFADETSYSFTDMTSNAGKFIAAGVDMESAVTAMQGISTWAALSGANTEQASRAMYNLSQAMGMGAVRVQDWMSIENANMATKQFKEMAIQAALVKKTLAIDNDGIVYAPNTKAGVDVDTKNFRSTLSEGWFTSEVLTEVLNQYGKAADLLYEAQQLSGVDTTKELLKIVESYKDAGDAISKEKIFTDFINKQDLEDDAAAVQALREQFDLLTSQEYDLAVQAFRAAQEAKTFKEVVDATKDAVSTKWMNVFEDIFGRYDQAKELWSDVADIAWDLFAGPIDNLHAATQKWSESGGLQDVRAIIVGILDSISSVWQAIRDVINLIRYGTTEIDDQVTKTGEVIEGVATKKARRLKAITEAVRTVVEGIQEFVTSGPFQLALLGIGKVIESLAGVFKSIWGIIKTIFGSIVKAFQDFINKVNLNRFADATSFGFETKNDYKKLTFISALVWIRQKLDDFAEWLRSSKVLTFISDTIGKFVGFLLRIPGKINDAFKSITGISVGEALQKLFGKIKDGFKWVMDNKILQSIWNGIKSFFSMIGNGLKSIAGVDTYGELFEKVRQKAATIFTAIGSFFQTVWNKIKEIAKVSNARELWDKIKSKVHDFFDFIKGLFSKKKEKGEESLISTASSTSIALKNSEKVAGTLDKAKGSLTKVLDAASAIPKAISNSSAAKKAPGIWENVKKILSDLKNALGKGFRGLLDFIRSINWSDIFLGLFSIKSLLKQIRKLRVSKAILNISEGIRQFGLASTEFANAATQYAKAQKKFGTAHILRNVAAIILSIGIAVGLIAYSIWQLGRLDPESLKRGTIVVGAILAALMALIIIIVASMKTLRKTKADKLGALSKTMSKTLSSISILLTAMAFLMSRLVKQIIKLSKVKDREALRESTFIVMALLAAVFVMTAAFMKLMQDEKEGLLKNGGTSSTVSKQAASTIAAAALMMIALTIVTKSLVKSVIKLAKAGDPGRLWSAFAIMALLMGAIFAIVYFTLGFMRDDKEGLLKNGKKQATLSKQAASTIAAVALLITALGATISSLAASLMLISRIKPDRLMSSLGVFAILVTLAVAAVGILITLTNSTEMKEGKNVNKSEANFRALLALSLVMVAFGAMVASMAKALAILALIKNPGGVLVAMLAIGVLLVALIGIIAIAKNVSVSTLLGLSATFVAIGASMILMATAFILLLPVIAAMSKFKFGDLAKVAGGILLILSAFAVGGMLLKFAIPGLLAFGAFVLIFSVSIGILAVSLGLFAAGLAALGAGIAAFSATIVAAGPIIKAAVRTLVAVFFEAIEAVIVGILDTLIAILPVLGDLVVTAIKTVCDVIIESVPKIVETVVVVVNAVLDGLMNIMPKLVETIFSLLMLILDAVAQNAYTIGEAFMRILIGVFQAMADNIAPLVHAFADLLVNLFNALTGELPRILESLGGLLFSVVENTIGTLVKAVFQSFGEALSIFAEAAGTFWDVIKSVDPAAMAAISLLGAMMLELTAASVLESLNKLMTFGKSDTPLVALGKQLGEFAPYLTKFAQDTEGINAEHVEHVANACKMLGELATSLPKSGGIFQFFAGETMSMETFGAQLQAFGQAFVMFYNSIKEVFPIDSEAVESVANAGATMAGLYNKLPKEKGWAQAIFGESMSLSTFGTQLKEFGEAFVTFYKVVKKAMPIDKEVVDSVTNAGATLAGLYNKLPRQKGWTQAIFGEAMSLSTFGTQLKEFAEGFVGFYNVIKKVMPIDNGLVMSVSNVASIFANLYSKLPREGGWIDNLLGKPTSLKTFGADMVEFGKAFVKFYDVIKQSAPVDEGLVTTVGNVASVFASLYDKLPRQDGWIDNLFGKAMNLKDFGNDLVDFAKGFNKFYLEISKHDVDETVVATVTNAASSLAELYTKINAVGHSGWLESVFGKKTIDLSDFGNQLATFGTGFNTFYEEISKHEINQSIVDTVTTAAQTMVGLYKEINFNGGKEGWLESIFGKKTIDLGDFGKQLGEFGDGFNIFYEKIKDLDVKQDQVTSVSNAAKMMVELYKGLDGEKGGVFGAIKTFFAGSDYENKKKALQHSIEFMGLLATSMKENADKLTANQGTNVSLFTKNLSSLIQDVADLLANAKSVTDMKNVSSTFSSVITTLADAISTAAGGKVEVSGGSLVEKFIQGMANKLQPDNLKRTQVYETFDRAISDFCVMFSLLMKTYMTANFVEVGLYIVEGMITGMAMASGQTQQAAASLAQSVIRPLQNTLQIKSPSRVTEQFGKYVTEGLAIGIRSQAALVDSASSDIAFDAMDTMSEAIRASRNIVDSALDDGSMVLTPVLDLSQIQNGAYAISQMMSEAGNYSIGGTFDYANKADASRRSADISDPSVVSLDKLSGAIEELIRNPQGTVSNNFTINSTADPQEIAEEVSKIIQMQVERRQAVWGR